MTASTTLVQYAVRVDDTIQDIARSQMGDSARWTDIVALNHLRRPYISTDFADQFGPMLGTFALQQPLAAGATQIASWDTGVTGYASSAAMLVPGNIVLFAVPNASGGTTYDAATITAVAQSVNMNCGHTILTLTFVPISSYRSLTGVMTTAIGGLALPHNVGDTMQVYGNPMLLATAVAQPGDLLTLPVPSLAQGDTNAVTSTSDVIDVLGTDIALDQNGHKQVGPTGDVATVSGQPNVAQALRTRINTTPGELSQQPNYGCELQFYVGANHDAHWPDLALALIHDCVLSDPRVRDVPTMAFTQVGEKDVVDLNVATTDGGQLLKLSTPVPG